MNYKAVSYAAAVAAMLGTAYSQELERDYVNISPYFHSMYHEPVRTEQVTTAYSSMMEHYYKSVWEDSSSKVEPQVIIIHEH